MVVDGKTKDQVDDKGGFFKFLKEVKGETKRITWPNKKQIKKAAIAVATFCLMYIFLVGGLDMIFQNLFRTVLGIK